MTALPCVVGVNPWSNVSSPGCGLVRWEYEERDITHDQPLFW